MIEEAWDGRTFDIRVVWFSSEDEKGSCAHEANWYEVVMGGEW